MLVITTFADLQLAINKEVNLRTAVDVLLVQ
jgi:hypothetical protein